MGLALVGNPGSGKSTILNGIAGKVVFKSAVSTDTGMTTALPHHYGSDHVLLFDTPGLVDIEKKKQAGMELNKMLSESLPLKIVFVVTLEGSRVKQDDAMIIDVVLSAIQSIDTNDKFGIIINQVSAGVANVLDNSPEHVALIRKQLTRNRWTSHWCQISLDDSLTNISDGMLMTAELRSFFARLPETRPLESKTKDLKGKMVEHAPRTGELEAGNETAKQELMEQIQREEDAAAAFDAMNKANDLQLRLLAAAQDNAALLARNFRF